MLYEYEAVVGQRPIGACSICTVIPFQYVHSALFRILREKFTPV